jgi:hypothetical protein
MSETLKLRQVDGGAGYFLDGEQLRAGEHVELLLHDGQWLGGVYEWNGQEIRWPAFRFLLGGSGPVYASENSRTAVVALPPDAVLRRRPR